MGEDVSGCREALVCAIVIYGIYCHQYVNLTGLTAERTFRHGATERISMKKLQKGIAMILAFMTALALPCFALAADGDEVASGELLYDADFSITSAEADLPSGWALTTYEGEAVACLVTGDDATEIAIISGTGDDARVWQDVAVTPETIYRVTVSLRTEGVEGGQGASLSVDNYSLDGCYCYSDCIYGSEERQQVSLYFMTDAGQQTVRIAMRLGGYGMESVGEAYFSGISMVEISATDENVIALADVYAFGDEGVDDEADSFLDNGTGVFTAMLLCTALVLLVGAILYGTVIRNEGELLRETSHSGLVLAGVLVACAAVRIILSVIFYGHTYDIACFMAWGNAVAENGTSTFYTSGMFADYPPGYMYVCGLMALIGKALSLSYGTTGYALLFKLPSIVADLCMAYFAYRVARKQSVREPYALVLAALIALNPATAFVSGAWGQVESILMLLLALSMWMLHEEKPVAGGLVYGLAVLLKPQALMFGPILAVGYVMAFIRAENRLRQLLKTLLAVVGAFAVIIILSLPFKGTQEFTWILSKYFGTATSYPYASVEAFNFPALLGDNWASVNSTVLGVPYTVWGPIFIGIAIVYAAFLHVRSHKNADGSVRKGSLYLCASVMMFIIFSFGYYMHERYLMPVLLLLLLAYLYERDRRLLVTMILSTASILLNVLAAMYIVDHQDLRGTYYQVITAVGSAMTVLTCLFAVYTATDLLLLGHRWEKAAPVALFTVRGGGEPAGQTVKVSGKAKLPAILPELATDTRLHLGRKDIILVTALTVVYGVTAILNLGTLSSPQTYWQSTGVGETVTIQFDGETYVSEYWVFGNIADDGQMLLTTDGGEESLFTQSYDDMFRWCECEAGFTASSVTLTVYGGELKINEIAFIDADGSPIPVTVVNPEGTEGCLVDEQQTVPDRPSYLNGMYFDELYHARTAYEHVNNLSPYENSHPPLGKLIIAIGILIFGMCPFGWRIMGTLFGIGMLPILYVFAKRLFGKTEHAFTATFLFAFDFMHFTQTRIATIDVFAVFFILLMYYFMYEYMQMNFFTDGLKKTLRPLALSGIFFGLGCASKWICIYAGGGLAVLFFTSLATRWQEYRLVMSGKGTQDYRRPSQQERMKVEPFAHNVIMTLLWCCLFFVAIPLAIYMLSYLPYYVYEAGQTESYGLKDALSTWAGYQEFMWSYHSGLNATHPYQSAWYQWPFTVRPMWYYSGNDYVRDTVSTITASGNPAVWWVSTIGAVALLVLRLSGKVKKDRALQVFFVGVMANYLPWVLVSRCTFIYHFFATVPFILLATVYLEMKGEERYHWLRYVRWGWMAVCLVLFILLYPGLSGLEIPAGWAAFIKNLPGGGLMYGA